MVAQGSPFSYAQYQQMTPDGVLFGDPLPIPRTLNYKQLLKTCPIGCLTAMYDTNFLGKQYMPDLPKGQDYALWLQILRQVPFAHGIEQVLGYYRTGGKSLSSNKLSKAISIWHLYRHVEAFSLLRSSLYMIRFCFMYAQKARHLRAPIRVER